MSRRGGIIVLLVSLGIGEDKVCFDSERLDVVFPFSVGVLRSLVSCISVIEVEEESKGSAQFESYLESHS